MSHPSGVQSFEIAEHLGFNVGTAVHLIWIGTDLKVARTFLQRAVDSGNIYGTGSYFAETAVARVMSCGPSLLTRILQALMGGPAYFHAITPRSVRNALEVLDAEIARVESEAA